MKYYIYVFERNGIEGCTGLLEYPTMRQTLPVVLTDKDREEIQRMEQDIVSIIETDTSHVCRIQENTIFQPRKLNFRGKDIII